MVVICQSENRIFSGFAQYIVHLNPNVMRLFLRLFAIFLPLVSILSSHSAFSQTPSSTPGGTITGSIRDGETGDVLRGATVQVLTTKKGAIADVKGTFTIKGVPAGTYSLRFNYIGFKPKTVEGFAVSDGQTATLNVNLESAVKKTEEVVVQAARINDNAAAILAQRKNAAQVSDGISEAEIKKLPDSDAGQALRRVSGVTLSEGKFVFVRGVSERYNNTTLNGTGLSSTEPDKKAFAFDMFPAEFLQSASVAKSFTPDLPGNFVGGLVQLNTVDFPQAFSIRASVSGSFNDNVNLKQGAFQTYPGGATDWLGIDNGLRALPSSVPTNRFEMDKLRSDANAFLNGNQSLQAASDKWLGLGKAFSSSTWERQGITAAPNLGFGLSFSNLFTVADNDFGVIASLTYNNSYSINTMSRLANGAYDAVNKAFSTRFEFDGSQSTRSVNWGGLLNLAYKLGASSSISWKNIYNRSSDDEVIYLEGNDAIPRDVRLTSYQFVQKELISTQLGGEHTIEATNLLVDWRIGYSRSTRDEPDFRRLRYSRNKGSSAPYIADISISPQGDGTQAGRFYSGLFENVVTGGFNASVPFADNTAKIKGGAFFENRNRSFKARSLTIIQSSAISSRYEPIGEDLRTLSPENLLSPDVYGANGLAISEDSKATDSYEASERLIAGYAMADVGIALGETQLKIIGGVRVEGNAQILTSPYSFKPNSNEPDSLITTNLTTLDFLPSLSLLWKANATTNLRLSASQTLTRPSLREFAPFSFYDFQTLSVVRGNPNLKRALVQNFDIRYEFFPRSGEVLSVGVFYKTFIDAIENTIAPTPGEIELSFQNANGIAYNYGVELELRKALDFISADFSNFLVNANVALINSEITVQQGLVTDKRTMQGQSPYSVNIGLSYNEPNTRSSFNLAYNIAGEKIVQVARIGAYNEAQYYKDIENSSNAGRKNPHVYELPRSVIDFSFIQPLFDNALEIKFAVRDILNQALVREQFNKRVESNIRGRSFSIGISYRFR